MSKPTFKAKGPRQVGALLPQVLGKVLHQRAGIDLALIEAWPEIVSTRLAKLSRPHKLRWPKGESNAQATLYVAVEPAGSLIIQHETASIIRRVNSYFGYNAVRAIKLVQTHNRFRKPKPAPRPQPTADQIRPVNGIHHEDLSSALEQLARNVAIEKQIKFG